MWGGFAARGRGTTTGNVKGNLGEDTGACTNIQGSRELYQVTREQTRTALKRVITTR